MKRAVKKFAGYLIFVGYLSLAGILYMYISMPETSSGPLCGGHHQVLNVPPREEYRTPPILLRPVDEFYQPQPQESDGSGSSKMPRIAHC